MKKHSQKKRNHSEGGFHGLVIATGFSLYGGGGGGGGVHCFPYIGSTSSANVHVRSWREQSASSPYYCNTALQSSFGPHDDDFFDRYSTPRSRQQFTERQLPSSPQPWVNEEPGQPLARRLPEPRPATVDPRQQQMMVDTPDELPPHTMMGLQPDQFGGQDDDWQQHYYHREDTTTVQGNSRTTWSGLRDDRTRVQLGSEGRPVSANVEVWSGPNNVPSRMKIYSEDGARRPWNAAFATISTNGGSPALDVRNEGPLEFPMSVRAGRQGPQTAAPSPNRNNNKPVVKVETKTVEGGALEYFSVAPETQRLRVLIFSEGLPILASVELWQGLGTIKQVAEIYTDNGAQKPWSAIIETPGYGCTLAISNTGPVEYPLSARVEM